MSVSCSVDDGEATGDYLLVREKYLELGVQEMITDISRLRKGTGLDTFQQLITKGGNEWVNE